MSAEQAAEQNDLAPTSEEMDGEEKKSMNFSVYDAMLMCSAIFVAIAILLLFLELRTFGNFPFAFPWRSEEFLEGG